MLTILLFSITVYIISCFIAVATVEAQGRSYFRTADSGKSNWMDAYYGWNDDCSFRTISVDVVGPPKHGRVSPKLENQRITSAQVGSTGKCLGKPTRAVAVYYRSDRGYRGTDRFRVRMKVGGQPPVFFSYTVRVK